MQIHTKSNKLKEILQFHKEGYKNEEISKILGIEQRKIMNYLNRKGLKSNRYQTILEDNQLTQLILGSILGDGHLCKIIGAAKNSRLQLYHGIKQKEYIQYKIDLLKNYNLNGKLSYINSKDTRVKAGFSESYGSKSVSHPIFSYYRTNFYIDNVKVLNKEILKKLDAFGLAIWFMDDSSKATSGYQIQTCSFSKEEIVFLMELLKQNFNIDATYQQHDNILYIKANSVETFNNLVEPYVIPSMKYKLLIRVQNKLGELSETPEVVNTELSANLND